jgi:hypothetical protein
MKTVLLAALLLTGTWCSAQSSGFGAGIILGEPTGISVKGWISGDRAIDGAVAWSLRSGSYFSLHADYLFHNMDLIHLKKGKLPLYYGPGLRLRTWNGDRYCFPVGLDYLPDRAPVDIFLELVPALDLVPGTDFDISGAVGARYWF